MTYTGDLANNEIFVTDLAHNMIRDRAIGEWQETGRRVDGGWVIPISNETMRLIAAQALDDETWSDTIERMCSTKM